LVLKIRLPHLSVHTCEQWQHGWLDLDAVCDGEWGRAWYGCVRFWWWSSKGKGQFGVNLRRPIVTNGDFVASLRGSAYSDRAIIWGGEWGGPGIHVLDGGPRASRGRVCFWHGFWHFSAFVPHSFQWAKWREKYISLVCEKLTIFPYAEYIVELRLAFLWCSQVQDRSGRWRDIYVQKRNTRKIAAVAAAKLRRRYDDLHVDLSAQFDVNILGLRYPSYLLFEYSASTLATACWARVDLEPDYHQNQWGLCDVLFSNYFEDL